MIKTNTTYLIAIQVILFVLFLILTSWFNRWSADDFYFIGELRHKSFYEVYQQLYFHWHGRWTSNFSQLITFQYSKVPFFLFFINLVTFSLLTHSIYSLIKIICNKTAMELSPPKQWLYSLLFLSVFFFCCVNPASTWFWHTSTVVYLWSIIAFLYLIAQLLSCSRSLLKYLIIIFTSLYIGGSNEPLAIISLLGLGIWVYLKGSNLPKIFSIIFILGALLINYFSSGTAFRDSITPGLGLIDLVLYTGYGSLKYLFWNAYKTFIPAIVLALPFYFLGNQFPITQGVFNIRKELSLSLIIILVTVIINQFMVIYALGGLAPDRSTTVSSIVISFVLVRFLFLWGQHQCKPKMNQKFITVLSIIGMLIFNGITFFYHHEYANAYDQRMEAIKQADQDVIEVAPLPFSGYLYSAELSTDSSYFANQHLKSGLGLKQQIILKEN